MTQKVYKRLGRCQLLRSCSHTYQNRLIGSSGTGEHNLNSFSVSQFRIFIHLQPFFPFLVKALEMRLRGFPSPLLKRSLQELNIGGRNLWNADSLLPIYELYDNRTSSSHPTSCPKEENCAEITSIALELPGALIAHV